MKKITFKVSPKKEGNVVSLIKEVNKISCRIQIDLENGFVTVENVEDTMIDSIIELIDKYYTISSVNIDNTSDESTLVETSQSDIVTGEPEFAAENTGKSETETEIPGEPEFEAESTDELESKAENTAEPKNNPTIVGPQSEDDFIIQKVNFANEYVEDLINKFVRTAYWAMYNMHATEKEIGDFIRTSMSEISMRYNKKWECVEYSVGDIVDCNYGRHLTGEVNGGHIISIVCSITPVGLVYLVPITRAKENITCSFSYLTFDVPEDVIFYEESYNMGGSVLLDKGRYLREERVNSVIGKTTPEFFTKVLKQLGTTFDFTNFTPMSEPKPKKTIKKIGGEESALLNVIGDSLEKLDRTKTVEEQVETFLTDIGMATTEEMVTQSFMIACNIKKINYENVILELHNMFPKENEDTIKSILKENFKNWLSMHPEIEENCPKISLMAILKVFAKKFA